MNNTDNSLSNKPNAAFEEWWQEHGLSADPPVLEMAYKEIALKGWVAAAEKCAIICEFWGDESRSVIRNNFLPQHMRESHGVLPSGSSPHS